MEHNKNNMILRDKLILQLYYNHGISTTNISKISYKDALEYMGDDLEIAEYIERTTDNFLMGKKGTRLSHRAIQDVVTKQKEQFSPEEFIVLDNRNLHTKYEQMYNTSLDEEFSMRLSDPNLVSFLRGCGYNNNSLTLNQLRKSQTGFSKNKSGQFYVHQVYDSSKGIYFIKYGITNTEVEQRINTQLRNSKRDTDYNYKSITLWCSPILDGGVIYDVEFNIKKALAGYPKVPKHIYSDGYSETILIEDCYYLEELVSKHFNVDIEFNLQ